MTTEVNKAEAMFSETAEQDVAPRAQPVKVTPTPAPKQAEAEKRIPWTKQHFFAQLDDVITEVKESGVENWGPWLVEYAAMQGLGFARGFMDALEKGLGETKQKKAP